MEAKFKVGEKAKITNHPDKNKIGNEVEIINAHHADFNPQKGYIDEWLYNVWDGTKSLGWAPECDLESIQKNFITNKNISEYNFRSRLNNTSKMVQAIIKDFEDKYGLNCHDSKDINYQVHLANGEIFRGFYISTKVYASHWDNEIDILVSFWRTKKDGKKSKVSSGFFLKEIMSIDNLPF